MDPYNKRARLYPALIATLPVFLGLLAWFPEQAWDLDTLYSLLAGSGTLLLTAQIARYLGKRKEKDLFVSWGGPPTTRFLRFRDATNRTQVERYHQKLNHLLPDMKLPKPEEEASDPELADEIYETYVNHLRERTRDAREFPLLFQENCNYGFWRNLWGLRPIGILFSVFGTITVAIPLYQTVAGPETSSLFAIAACLTNIGLLIMWLTFKKDRISMAAEAYADRLLASCEVLVE